MESTILREGLVNNLRGFSVLPPTCELAKLLMTKAHNTAYMGGSDTCYRSRQKAWIVRACPLANKVAADCLECRQRFKVPLTQREERRKVVHLCPPIHLNGHGLPVTL